MNPDFNLIGKEKVIHYPHKVVEKPLVSVSVVTFNHERFIRKCLNGILMQQTCFDYEVLLGEDDSSDNTRQICVEYAKKYPGKIRLFLHSRENNIKIGGNPTGRFNFLYNCSKAKGKYIAFCEGDNYWTDPYKLQKQVDFLENNPDYGMVHTDQDVCNSKGRILQYAKNSNGNIPVGFVKNKLIIKNFIGTLTVCMRKDVLDKACSLFEHKYLMGDFPLWVSVSLISKIGYINKSTATYRLLRKSVSNRTDIKKHFKFLLSGFELRKDFIEKYDFSNDAIQGINRNYAETLIYYGILLNQKMMIYESRKLVKSQNISTNYRIKILSFLATNSVTRKLLSLLLSFKWRMRRF